MCGFAGAVVWDERYRVSPQTLSQMSAAVAHRGPDGHGSHHTRLDSPIDPANPQVALAFRRLAILDPDPRSNQPFTVGSKTLVFNGEIYNFRDLRQELTTLLPDWNWRTTGDTEVLLAAYTAWGEHCVEHLNGMFAFAVWDEAGKTLFLARDRMGQKPLYVACLLADGRFAPTPLAAERVAAVAFASELPALLPLNWIHRTPHAAAVAVYLSLGYVPDGTIYAGPAKLQPATCTSITAHRAFTRWYFSPFRSFIRAECSDRTAAGRTRELVRTAVRQQLISDVPVGCFLSGGIDSSIMAAAMRAAAPAGQDVFTFAAGFDDPRYDERPAAAAVARHIGSRHIEFHVRPDAAADLPRLAAVFGEPFADSSALPTHYLARATREHVKVALSGDGGDELFGGYDRYRALAFSQRLQRWGLGGVLRLLSKVIPGTHPKSRSVRLRRLARSVGHTPADRYASYVELFAPADIAALLDHPVPSAGRFDNLANGFSVGLAARPLVPNALAVDRWTYLPDDLLTKVDRCSMLHALEVRSPFMDHELVTFAAGLTTDQLLRGGPKRMLREAFAADLPAWVFKRKKMGFAVPIGEWFRGPLRAMLRDTLFSAHAFGRGHFNMKVVERLVDEHESQRVDHSQRLYALLMLELWWNTVRPPLRAE